MLTMKLYPKLQHLVNELPFPSRKQELDEMAEFIATHLNTEGNLGINYICTHNSRRSQFSQIWSATAAAYYKLPISSYSGGVEVTAFNLRAVDSCLRLGFHIKNTQESLENPIYEVKFSEEAEPTVCFSKTYEDKSAPKENFITMMTCGHADENCPFIPGALKRIPFRFDDPKAYDDTDLEAVKYDERSLDIASEIFYLMKSISERYEQ